MWFKNKDTRAKYKFLKNVILTLDKKNWSTKELQYIYNEYKIFLKKIGVDEISALRTGEIFLGKYCNVDFNDVNDVRDLVYKCCEAMEEITPNVCTAIIGALVKLSLASINGEKLDFNDFKEERLE